MRRVVLHSISHGLVQPMTLMTSVTVTAMGDTSV